MFIHRAVYQTRVFINRLLEQLRLFHNAKTMPVSSDMKKDLSWLLKFLEQYNGTCSYRMFPLAQAEQVELDASLQGFGGVFGSQVYMLDLNEIYVPGCMHITHLEMWNVLVAVRLWGSQWRDKYVCIKCDNEAVVSIINTGSSRDIILSALIRNIVLQMSMHNFQLKVVHIPGVKNKTADLLSRWNSTVSPQEKLQRLVEQPLWCKIEKSFLVIDLDM